MDVLITSSSRLECLQKTIETFQKFIKFSDDLDFILHEDYVIKAESEKVVEWAKKSGIFSKILETKPAKRLGKAIEKLMSVSNNELVLKWKDDWELTREINLDDVAEIMIKCKDVNQIQFNKRENPTLKHGFNHRLVIKNGKELTLCREWGMAPAMWRLSWIKPRWVCHNNGDSVNQELLGKVARDENWCEINLGAYWYEKPGLGHFVRHLGYGDKNASKLFTAIDN
jgi:hypothetical protein